MDVRENKQAYETYGAGMRCVSDTYSVYEIQYIYIRVLLVIQTLLTNAHIL